MAMKKCKECGNEISTKAESCPNCGAVQKKKAGCLSYIGAGILIIILIGFIGSLGNEKTNDSSSSSSSSSSESSQKIYNTKETVHIGYTSYKVIESWWTNQLSDNEYINEPPKATYLFVHLIVRNDDDEARTIPPFKLVDENGSTYDTSSNAYMLDKSIGPLDSLNPNVKKQGYIVFDVPQNNNYKLKISGGYWSNEEALVKLSL